MFIDHTMTETIAQATDAVRAAEPVAATTNPDEPVIGLHTRHYPQFGTRLGALELPAGSRDLTLSVVEVATEAEASCKIAGIQLIRNGERVSTEDLVEKTR